MRLNNEGDSIRERHALNNCPVILSSKVNWQVCVGLVQKWCRPLLKMEHSATLSKWHLHWKPLQITFNVLIHYSIIALRTL